jgi:DNA adenine methylase
MWSFLRWAGSKRKALPALKKYVPMKYDRYIEPFAGSACLFFELQPERAILGDLNQELICTLREVQTHPDRVIETLQRLPKSKSGYYKVRAISLKTLTPVEIAARFIYLNHFCFNGLYRTNSAGEFNVPVGREKKDSSINVQLILAASDLLKSAFLVGGDFEKVAALAGEGDFVYLDPPYVVRRRRIFSEYLADSFNHCDLGRFQECLERLDSKGATFLVSYADSSEARKMFAKWKTARIALRRNISGFAGSRTIAYELIATNRKKSTHP